MEEKTRSIEDILLQHGVTVSTAESCTGGGIAARLTSVSGSSRYVMGGIVSYQDYVKEQLLGVSADTISRYGVVSRETVIEMARGACRALGTDAAVSTSGIAGPTGAEPGKPVGTIWMAAVCGDVCLTYMQSGDDGRAENIARAIENALELLGKAVIEAKE